MNSSIFLTINNILSLIALGYLALIVNGVLKAPTRETRERYEAFKNAEHIQWIRIGVPVLFVVILLLSIFDKSY